MPAEPGAAPGGSNAPAGPGALAGQGAPAGQGVAAGCLPPEDADDFYEQSPCGYVSTRPDGTIVRLNETLVGWLGRTRAELLAGVRFQSLLTVGGRIFFDTHFAPLLHMQGRVDEIAFELARKGAAPLPVLVNAVCKTDPRGAPLMVRMTLFNATDRRRYERELLAARQRAEQLEQRLRLAVQSSSLGTFDWDVDADEIDYSRQARRMFGWPAAARGAATLASHLDPVLPADRARVLDALARARDAGGDGEYAVQYRIARPDGAVRWLDAVGQAQFEGAGATRRVVRIAGVLRDVTEQRELVAQLQEADRRKDEFLAMLAHEIRNPLAPLRNALRILAHEPLTARGHDALQLGSRQVGQIVRLVDDLLEVSRITRGKIALRCEPVDVGTIVRQVAQANAPALLARAQPLSLALPDVGPSIVADPVRLTQMVENLLTNASKYSDDDCPIRIRVTDEADTVSIEVIDEGVGIEPDQLARLFEPFTQVDSTLDRAQGGLGIGLALVRRLAEMHGGSASAHSAGRGQGSRFVVRLPRRP